jgi:hypothetical protein
MGCGFLGRVRAEMLAISIDGNRHGLDHQVALDCVVRFTILHPSQITTLKMIFQL